MAYAIYYSQETAYRYPPDGRKKRSKPGKWILLALLLIAALWLRQNGMPDFLIPGDVQITKAAASTLVEELQNNVPVNEAVTAFCRSVIHGAQR